MQSSSSNGSSASGGSSSNHKKDSMDLTQPNGELFLLYRHLRNRKIYHGFNAKSGSSRKKGVMIPQEFSGKWPSFIFYIYFICFYLIAKNYHSLIHIKMRRQDIAYS